MHVLYIGKARFPDHNAACFRISANKKIIEKCGYDVDIIGVGEKNFPHLNGKKGFNLNENSKLSVIKNSIKLWTFIKSEENNYRYIIFYNYPTLMNILYLFKYGISKYREKIILDITEWYQPDFSNPLKAFFKWVDICLRNIIFFKIGQRHIITSDFYKKDNQKKLLDLPTLFDVQEFKFKPSFEDNKIKFINIGNLNKENKKSFENKERLDWLVKTFLKLNEKGYKCIELHIFGTTEEEFLYFYPNFNKLSKSNIFFKGFQANSVVKNELASSDFSIFFREEKKLNQVGFPGKMAESISCGTPVITSKISSLKKYEKYNFIYLVNNDSLEEKLEEIVKLNKEKMRSLKKEAYQSQLFHYDNYVASAREFFND